MKINKRLFRKSALTSMVAVMVLLTTSCADLWKEQHPGTYYTNNGETVADYLNGKLENHGNFTYFKAIIKEANLWGQMQTYGTYTVFAPDDSAIVRYIRNRRAEAIAEHHAPEDIARFTDINTALSDHKLCDTIARTHIFNKAMYAADLNGDGILEEPNLLDKYISYFSDSIMATVYAEDGVTPLKDSNGNDSVVPKLRYLINMQSFIIKEDDSVQNGVVHKIEDVLRNSNKLICGVIKEDPELTLFYEALKMTHLEDTLEKYYIDLTYPGVSPEWTKQAILDGDPSHHFHSTSVEKHESEVMPEERKFLFTVFVVKDSVLKADYGIESFSDFVNYAKGVYTDATETDPTSRASAINRLISYHILPYFLTYDQFNTCNDAIIKNYKAVYTANGSSSKNRVIDSEDFFATLLPHSIMRISTPWKSVDPPTRLGGIYINRKGVAGVKEVTLDYEGIRIAESSEYGKKDNKAENGIYHYVDKLLLYDTETKEQVLDCRMRIMSCTLSPDFVNSGGRGRMRESHDMVYCFYPDYCDNFDWVEGQTGLYVRYRDASFGTFNGDELSIMYNYDISLKLPPVPSSGTYELRIWNNAISGLGDGAADRGVVQFYYHEGTPGDDTVYWRNWYWEPEDIPVDLRITGDDGRIGMVLDNSSDITNLLTEKEQQAAIDANDRAMRNRLYMKAMDSYGSLRTDKNCYRKIVWRRYMRDNTDYYLRMRQMYTSGTGVMPFSFIEIVPKDVYEGNEDRH